jgi:hypothetical protein
VWAAPRRLLRRTRSAAHGARLSCPAVDRNTVLWTLVVFFGASVMFGLIREAADEDGAAVTLAAQLAAGLLLVAVIVLIMRRRQ